MWVGVWGGGKVREFRKLGSLGLLVLKHTIHFTLPIQQ